MNGNKLRLRFLPALLRLSLRAFEPARAADWLPVYASAIGADSSNAAR